MKKIFDFIKTKHNTIFKVFLFVLSIALIVFIFPSEGKFKYEFQKGKPWPHVDLIAPFNFAIYKAPAELQTEKDNINQEHKPYFFRNLNVRKQALENFNNNFEKQWENKPDSTTTFRKKNYYQQRGEKLINEIYKKGIIESNAKIEEKPVDFEIQLLNNNVAEPTELKALYTLKQAYLFINTSLSDLSSNEKQFMLGLLEGVIKQNVSYDEDTNELMLNEELNSISPTKGMVQRGERLIAKGELMNDYKFQMVESLKKQFESQSSVSSKGSLILIGQIILVTLLILSLGLFLLTLRQDIIRSDSKIIFLLSLIVLFVFASKMALNIENVNLYLVPFCMLPLVIRTFFDLRLAIITYLIAILTIGFIAPNPYEFVIIEMIAGIITMFGIPHLRNRGHLFFSSLILLGVYCVIYLSIGLLQEGSLQDTNWRFLGWFFGSAMLTLFTYPLVYIFEKIFGFVSDVTLMELSDTNSKLLRKLNLKAPGTFQHSLQVSNLAEEAIREIGGNALLARTGALYHDIGKMHNPNYFIENQNSDYNPHEELSPEESAAIIIDHVIKGIEIARRFKLPDVIIDFIRTHHGTSMTLFFYRTYKEENPEENVDESKFRYPGPIPYSKETAVLMMADSVEAASRSLTTYDRQSIEKLVDGIIDRQIKEQQFITASITFKDITVIKKILKKKLISIYHVRVEYPEDKG